jgi:geranylgeranyl diphosphate synthase type I
LTRARDLVAPALRRSVGLLAPELQSVAAYHLGWVDPEGRPTGSDGGKGVRPALAILSAEAVGAPSAVGVPGAVAVELVHNFSLIHDDVIDNDAERRHRPTVWAVFGIGRAVIVGDALVALAQQVALDPAATLGASPALDGKRAALCLADATAAMIAGQALDMAFESAEFVTFDRCLEMEAGKTGALLGCASSIGAVLAGAGDETVAALDRFGVELGLSFQAVDDLLGIWGDPATTGKPTWSDIRQHKKSLPVTAALSSDLAEVEELMQLLTTSDLSEADVERTAHLVERCGGREAAATLAESRLKSALAALDEAEIIESVKEQFVAVAHFVVERQF